MELFRSVRKNVGGLNAMDATRVNPQGSTALDKETTVKEAAMVSCGYCKGLTRPDLSALYRGGGIGKKGLANLYKRQRRRAISVMGDSADGFQCEKVNLRTRTLKRGEVRRT